MTYNRPFMATSFLVRPRWAALLLCVALLAACATGREAEVPPATVEPPATKEPPTPADAPDEPLRVTGYRSPAMRLTSADDIRGDLVYLRDSLSRIHPALVDGYTVEQDRAIEEVLSRADAPRPFIDVLALMSSVVRTVGDEITAVEIPDDVLGPSMPVIALGGRFGGQLVAYAEAGALLPGDRILSVAGAGLDTAQAILRHKLGLTEITGTLLLSDALLSLLGFDLTRVEVPLTVYRAGETAEIRVARLTPEGEPAAYRFDPPSYRLTPSSRHHLPRRPASLHAPVVRVLSRHNCAYLRFDECALTPEYDEALRELFTATTMERLSTVVIDLRFNRGGDLRVLREFLRYLGAGEYIDFASVTRHSATAAESEGYRKDDGVEIARSEPRRLEPLRFPSLVFDGQVYVLVSRHTSGAAVRFASVVKDQDFGLVVGEPTAEGPAGFADPIRVQTPALEIPVSVSHKHFATPAGDDGRYSLTLSPDVIVEVRAEDVVSGFDPQLAYVLERAMRGR